MFISLNDFANHKRLKTKLKQLGFYPGYAIRAYNQNHTNAHIKGFMHLIISDAAFILNELEYLGHLPGWLR